LSSGCRLANPRFTPATNCSASPIDRSPTCVGNLSPALPSNSTTDPRRPSDPSTCLEPTLQLALATDPSACRPASLRLTPPANLSAQPSHRPATCAACRSSGPPSDSSPACAFAPSSSSTFQTDFRLAPSLSLSAPPSNLTSDSHRPPVPSALPSSQPAACAADRPSSPAWRTKRSTPAAASPALLPGMSPTRVFDLPFRLAFELNLRFLSGCIPSALPSG